MTGQMGLDVQHEYEKLLTVFYEVVDSKRGSKLSADEKWLFDAETLAVKLFYHLASILYLSHGTFLPVFSDRSLNFFDQASIKVLARASLETYLTFFYIYCDRNCNIEERKLRHLLWKLSSSTDRQGFNLISEKAVEALQVEKQVMDKMLAEIEENPFFLAMEEKSRKKARKGEWRLGKSWSDLADLAGFAKQTFRTVYRYLCSYAHSGGLSGTQIGQAITIVDQKRLSILPLHLGLLLMSHFLFSYTAFLPETRKVLESDEDGYSLANKWLITWKEDGFKKTFSS